MIATVHCAARVRLLELHHLGCSAKKGAAVLHHCSSWGARKGRSERHFAGEAPGFPQRRSDCAHVASLKAARFRPARLLPSLLRFAGWIATRDTKLPATSGSCRHTMRQSGEECNTAGVKGERRNRLIGWQSGRTTQLIIFARCSSYDCARSIGHRIFHPLAPFVRISLSWSLESLRLVAALELAKLCLAALSPES